MIRRLPLVCALVTLFLSSPALAMTPTDVERELLQVSSLATEGKFAEALERLKVAIKAQPDQIPFHLAYIELLIAVDQRADAQRVYKTLLDRDPKQPTSLFLYGKTQAEPAKRMAQYEAALAIEPRHAWARMGLASVYVTQDKLDDAITELNRALTDAPTLEPALEMLGSLLVVEGRVAEAVGIYERLEAADPVSGRAPVELGRLYVAVERKDDAVAAYERAAALQPGNAAVQANLAHLHFGARRYAEAYEAYRLAMELDPGDDFAGVMMLVCEDVREGRLSHEVVLEVQGARFIEQTEPAKAMAVYQAAVKKYPRFMLAQLGYGRMLIARGDLTEGSAALLKAVALAPEYYEARMTTAELMINMDQYAEAEEHLKVAAQLQPTRPEAHMALGVVYTKARNPVGAEIAYRNATKLLEGEGALAAWINLSGAIAAQGRLEEASALLRDVQKVLPDNPDVFLGLASIYLEQERFDDAAAEAQRALKLNPSLTPAMNLLDEIDRERAQYKKDMATKQRASQIIVPKKDQAKDLLSKLKKGEDFATLARLFSHGPEAIDGGDLGFFDPAELSEELAEALAAIEVGQISGIIKTEAGYHILKRTH